MKFAVRAIINEAGVSIKDVTRGHVDSLCEMITKPKSGEVHLPRGTTVVKESGIVYIKPREGFTGEIQELVNEKIEVMMPTPTVHDEKANTGSKHAAKHTFRFYYPIVEEGNYMLPDGGVISCRILNDFDMDAVPDDTYTKWLDYAKMSDDLCLRTRKSGDYLVINKRGNEGNLKNYMINEKIPKSERDNIPLLAGGSKIYWVVGHRISEDVKVSEETTRVIEFKYKRPNDAEPEE